MEVDLHEVLHMVSAFLTEQNLHRTAATLIDEAKLGDITEAASAGDRFESAIIRGEWPLVLTMLGKHTFVDSKEVFEAVYAHLIMEMVCQGENHLARNILDEQKDILVPNWYQDLWAVLYESKMPFTMKKIRGEE